MENDLTLERAAACALNRIFGYEPKYARELLDHFGSAAAVFESSGKDLDNLFRPGSRYRGTLRKEAVEKAGDELLRLEKTGCRFVAFAEKDFPAPLKECPDAPAGLYYRSESGPSQIFSSRSFISMVGTRDISFYGKEWCPRLVGALASAGTRPSVVSGLALGVDIECHLAALSYGLSTIAVIPTGIDAIYPRRHSVAAGKIAASEGSAIVTDFPPGTSPVHFNFLRRNRIIAGMSQATVLVESKRDGGGMMTARLAFQYGRDVFALPGRIEDIRSEGCNQLLKEKIAEPVVSLESFPGMLGLGDATPRRKTGILDKAARRYRDLPPKSIDEIRGFLSAVLGKRGCSIDEAASAANIEYRRAASLAGLLETDGFIDRDLFGRCTIHADFM